MWAMCEGSQDVPMRGMPADDGAPGAALRPMGDVTRNNPGRPVLSVRRLSVSFRTDEGAARAVDDVSFDLFPGETLGIVGESGCGKTVTSKAILGLLPERVARVSPESFIGFDGRNLATAGERELQNVRGNRIAMVFQEPMTALNPVCSIGWQIDEAIKLHTDLGRKARRERVLEMLRLVEIPDPETRIGQYPHELSGGMRQRIMIAMALCCEPDVLIADEPTTALDVTIQAQILHLIEDLKARLGTSVLLITHDLGVIAQVCDRVLVMYAGQIVEQAAVEELFQRPRHPYTQALLESIPRPVGSDRANRRLPTIPGVVPSLLAMPSGCRFHERCSRATDRCAVEAPVLQEGSPRQAVRCFHPMSY
jgi:oligopeptide/dipeptide ABC transporter ATP-binding protein